MIFSGLWMHVLSTYDPIMFETILQYHYIVIIPV